MWKKNEEVKSTTWEEESQIGVSSSKVQLRQVGQVVASPIPQTHVTGGEARGGARGKQAGQGTVSHAGMRSH